MVAMSEALIHARITLLQVWLRMLLFSSVWPLTWCAEYKGPPETVIPLRVTVSSKETSLAGWMSYSLHFGGQRHIISMKSKNFLESRQLPVFTYNDQGVLFEDRPFVQNDCYYLGFVDGDPESMAALTTCFGGFQGILRINDTAYEIKPKKSSSSTFEHLLYKIDSEKTQLRPMRCGLTDEEIAEQVRLQEDSKSTLMQSTYGSWWSHGLYIKLALVIDHEQYLYRKRNTSLVVKDVFNIMNGINLSLRSVDINVVLLGLTIWTNENPIPVQDIYALLPAFCTWKRTNLNSQIPYDIAHLFVNYTFSNYFGIAYVGTVCNKTFGCGVDSLVEDDFLSIGHIVAHEIGHNLGMPHDGILCTCGEESCLMSAKMESSEKLSNCSYEVLWAHMIKKSCIQREPSLSDHFQMKVCGNGIVEDGEQCDCGTPESCKRNRCCMPSCILRSRAKCDTGLCCNRCQIQPSGTLCRAQENECDLPEWCNGTSHECPEDLFVQDGTSCPGNGYCYEKRCNSHDYHCQRVFGQLARKASDSCYKELNTRGDRFGNCGLTDNEYVRCETSDILCGRIQCDKVRTLPTLRSHYTVHWTHFNNVSCWSTDYHLGMKIADLGDIKDGTNCGPQHVCIARKCVNKPSWASDCSPETCNMKGVCNNKQHCHCNVGWSPPNCQETGTGGSIDSGSPGTRVKEDGNRKETSKKSNIIIWLLPIICVVVALFALFCLSGATKRSHEEAATQPPHEEAKPPDETVKLPDKAANPPDEEQKIKPPDEEKETKS